MPEAAEAAGLGRHLANLIASEGAIGIDRYMAEALGNPRWGYYMTRDPFGLQGDFITAPEVSQMFGELIGLWCAELWRQMGAPAEFHLVEIGPGRGTLMADALRAGRLVPPFLTAARLHLVETSPVLRTLQGTALADHQVSWHQHFNEVPPGPAIVVANELFDALPIRQFERTIEGWRERLVNLGPDGGLRFVRAAQPSPAQALIPEAVKLGNEIAANPEGTLREIKALLWNDLMDSGSDETWKRSGEHFAASRKTAEHRESLLAFREKRAPKFHDSDHMEGVREGIESADS